MAKKTKAKKEKGTFTPAKKIKVSRIRKNASPFDTNEERMIVELEVEDEFEEGEDLEEKEELGEQEEDEVAVVTDDNITDDDDDQVFPPTENLDEYLKENSEPLFPECAMRVAVAFIFANVYNAEPNKELWIGRSGIRTKIRKFLKLGDNTYLDNIFNDVVKCKVDGTTYTGKKSISTGRPPTITLDSDEAQISADCLEAGFSVPHAWTVVNQYRKENNLPSLTFCTVKNVIKRLKPLIRKIEKTRQGDHDEHSPWCKARCNWDTQMLILTGRLKGKDLDYLRVDGKLPKYFDPEQMPKMSHDQIVWWDETHRKCTIGGQGTTNEFYARFRRDENGKLDLENGKFDDTPIKKLNVKYEKEVRLCLGVAVLPKNDATGQDEVGVLADTLDYTGKCVKSIKNYTELVNRLNNSIRKSKDKKKWTTTTRVYGSIYEQDDVTILTNLAEKTKEKLTSNNITTVGELKHLSDETINLIDSSEDKTKRIARSKLLLFRTQAGHAIPGEEPPVIDHRLADNPWLSKYGEEEWEEQQRNAPSLKSFICITEVVEHIITASTKLYKGTEYENTWMFFHDALSLMTSKKTIEWMKKKDYYKRWILPINGLHQDDKALKYYFHKPVGNCPENMPLDTSLNNDIHEGVKRHINATWEMHEDCPEKFSMSTPKRGSYAYERVLTVLPASKRIVQDVLQVFKSMDQVRRAKGVLVDGVGTRYGSRWTPPGAKSSGRGGKRERLLAPDDYGGSGKVMHRDAVKGVDAKLKASRQRAAGNAGIKTILDKIKPASL